MLSWTTVEKLVKDQGVDSLETLASLSDDNITSVCNKIRRPNGLSSGRMSNRGIQISVVEATHLKLAEFAIETM